MAEQTPTPTETTHNFLVEPQGISVPIRCRIIENKISESESQFYYEVEFLPPQGTEFYQQERIYFSTKGDAFSEMSKYIGELKEPLQPNPNY